MIGGNDPDAIDVENHHHGFVWEVPFSAPRAFWCLMMHSWIERLNKCSFLVKLLTSLLPFQ